MSGMEPPGPGSMEELDQLDQLNELFSILFLFLFSFLIVALAAGSLADT